MKRSKYFVGLLLVISLLHSCVKDPQDIPDGADINPEFRISGILGSEQLNIEAGVNGWTMQPTVEESDSNIIYTSIFSKNCLDNCIPSLEFKFYRNLPAQNNDELDFLQTIRQGIKEYVKSDQERDSFDIQLSTPPGLFMNGFSSWINLNDSVPSLLPEYNGTIGYAENLNVCFQSFAYTGCQYTQCIYFDPRTLVPCLAYIEPSLEGGRYLHLMVRPVGTPPFTFYWFNESTFATTVIPVSLDSVTDLYVSVRVTDALGNYSDISQAIMLRNGDVYACYFPISLASTHVNNSSSIDFADKVEIIYTDENGEKWESSGGAQDPNTVMTILGIEDFGFSPLHQPAYKTTLSFYVNLFNRDTGESKYFATQNAVIALSHQ